MNRKLAGQYASALIEITEKHKKTLGVLSELKVILEVFKDDVMKFLIHPTINKTEKKYIVSKVLENHQFSQEVISFIYVLINQNRMKILPQIYKEFCNIKDEKEFLLKGELVTTELIKKEIQDEIIDAFNKAVKRKIKWTQKKDNSIIGGFKVQIQDKLFDATVRRGLEKIQDKIMK